MLLRVEGRNVYLNGTEHFFPSSQLPTPRGELSCGMELASCANIFLQNFGDEYY